MTIRKRLLVPALALALAAPLAVGGCAARAQEGELIELEFPTAAKHQTAGFRRDVVELPMQPTGDIRRGHQIEFSVRMKEGDALVYSMTGPAGQEVYHEFHGHDDERVAFYKREAGEAHHGSLIAPFEGLHGWFVENRSAQPATVRIELAGFYELIPPGEEGNEWEIEPIQSEQTR